MKNKQYFLPKKGFIAVATMILMIVSLSVVMAMLYRSTQGLALAGRLKQSNQAYQAGDQASEKILQNFRILDDGTSTNVGGTTGIDSTKKISQNVVASTLCVAPAVICYSNLGVAFANPATVRLSDVYQLVTSSTSASATRAVQAVVPTRISPPLTPILAAAGAGRTVTLTWSDVSTAVDAEFIQIRRTRLPLTAGQIAVATINATPFLSDPSIDWVVPSGCPGCNALPKTTTTVTDATGGVAGERYLYTMKFTNLNPLSLDSLYILPVLTPVLLP